MYDVAVSDMALGADGLQKDGVILQSLLRVHVSIFMLDYNLHAPVLKSEMIGLALTLKRREGRFSFGASALS